MGERVARRGLLVIGLVTAAFTAAAIVAALPTRYEVEGLSMAPGLMPGDVVATGWLPIRDRWRVPRRFDRWIVSAPDAAAAVKRVLGLPGETVAVVDGDVAVGGTMVLKSPAVLAALALELPTPAGLVEPRHLRLPRQEVLDDAPFATEVNRPLEPAHDVGLAAIVRTGTAPTRIRVGVDGTQITWRLPENARGCFVAGRLDGHVVAVGWRLPANAALARSGLPKRSPHAWSLATPSPRHDDGLAPALTLDVDAPDATVERLSLWRDLHYRGVDGGPAVWTLGPNEHVVLGDFPTGSRDSRLWGPLSRKNLRHRIPSHP